MSSQQQSITRFFAPKDGNNKAAAPKVTAGVKRKSSGGEKSGDTEEPAASGNPDGGGVAAVSPMSSPEAKKRATDNKLCAKIKLRSKELSGALHSNIGTSWFQTLQGEFDKPYFAQLSRYLEMARAKEVIYPPSEQVQIWAVLRC